ncbi:peptidase S9 [Pseudoxanthomonas kalamensis DSM 18571]|uniref:alpha/beta hydrolase family protein n=1 Tax=Pseudoxanthomonas kalamensis TaxID=289483 RepID=UPI001390D2A3|nr:S9 family peptidase [Pseudoxanthomonas kalamensis]KAF1709471.1 peptidase S9 [Pseudoxanthomonas kalamensis DSM 18571]
MTIRGIHCRYFPGAWLALLIVIAVSASAASAQVKVEGFIRKDSFTDIKISPLGDYYAATVQQEDRTALVILRRSDNKVTGSITLGRNNHVADFWWVNQERVLFSVAQKLGMLDQPQLTGELFAMNVDGSRKENLLGYRVESSGPGTRIQRKQVEAVAGQLVDILPDDEKSVLVRIRPFGESQYTRVERMDVYSGRRVQVARSPVPDANFATDASGIVRFAYGAMADNANKLYYRDDGNQEWRLINDEAVTGLVEWPVGFSESGRLAYLQVERSEGADSVVEWNLGGAEKREVLRNDNTDPTRMMYSDGRSNVLVGALFQDGKPVWRYLDPEGSHARMQRGLEEAFPGSVVLVTSRTDDGKLALLEVYSDTNPGDFYLFDTQAKKVDYILSRRDWLEPERMSVKTPVHFPARDGLALHGYLTVPKGSIGKGLPMVVLVHGGPFQVRDGWGFDAEVQMLAAAGYAVLQVNFRGSPGYGRAFGEAGAREWGGKMQDDVTDATRWAIGNGIADAGRICIYGASYGAYASMMGAAKEPDLYRCAAGYVGIYDLPMMYTRGDIGEMKSGRNYLRDWVGDQAQLAAVSPVNMTDRIKVPVFLAAGGEDERAPVQHTELMEKRLRAAGVPVESLYYKTEGHGFYKEENLREYYTKLLEFFGRNLGSTSRR